jgi:hypothetical protein
MPFEFVDNSAVIDRATRRRIRSHVAVGKNRGKLVVRPSRKEAFLLKGKIYIPEEAMKDKGHLERSKHVVPEIERQIGDGLSVLSLPGSWSPGFKGAVQKGMYSESWTQI